MARGGSRDGAGQHKGLNFKQRVFVEHYLQAWNATDAARRAGYKGNDITLASVGYENLRKPQIAEAIERRLAELQMGADEVIQRLSEHARGNLAPFLDSNANGLDLASDRAQASMNIVRKFKTTHKTFHRGETSWDEVQTEIELYDAQRALELLGRHLALFAEVALTGDVNDWREFAKANGINEAEIVAEAERIVNGVKRLNAASGAEPTGEDLSA